MLKRERQAFILREINLHNRVLSSDLCSQISVSEDTIRRDLIELADEGRLIRVHGGALTKSFHAVKKAMIESARKVVSLTISEKLNSVQRLQVCRLDETDVLITELCSDDLLLKSYSNSGLQVL